MSRPALDWGVAGRILPGQAESGDGYLVQESRNGPLVAVVDGLGHGEAAAQAARIAVATLARSAQESVVLLVRRCHEALRPTRGVVMSLASFNRLDRTMTWLGVGNVEGRLIPRDPLGTARRESLLLRPGVLGARLPPLTASTLRVVPGDTLIFATDGIRGDFAHGLAVTGSPQHIADRILAVHAVGTDDALVLVARCLDQET